MQHRTPGCDTWSVLLALGIVAGVSGGCGGSLDFEPPPDPPAPPPATPVPPAAASAAPAGPSAGSTPLPAGIDPNGPDCQTTERVVANLLRPRCGACHDERNPSLFAEIDLVGPRLRTRLNRPSRMCAGPDGQGRRLVFTEPQVGGHFFDLIRGRVPIGCGTPMPPTRPMLTEAEIQCLENWVKATE